MKGMVLKKTFYGKILLALLSKKKIFLVPGLYLI